MFFAGFIFLTDLKWMFGAMMISGAGVGITMNMYWVVLIQVLGKELYVYALGVGSWIMALFFLISGPIIGKNHVQ